MTVHEEHEDRMHQTYGLRPSKAAVCPRVVTGGRCRADGREHTTGDLCSCLRYHSTVLDHARIWLDPDGQHVLTAEPYSLDGDELIEFLTNMATLGLHVSLSGRGQWHPTTILIQVTRADPG